MPPIVAPIPADSRLAGEPGGGLDRAFVRSVAWNGVARWVGQLFTWVSTIGVARLLSPSDYGLVGMATVFTALVTMMSEFGLGTAIVALRTINEKVVAQLNSLSIIAGGTALLIAVAFATPLGWFFEPEVTTIVLVLSSTFLIGAFKVVPHALLQRELRFRLLSLIEAFRAVVVAAIALAVAWAGFGYWALVAALVFGTVFSTVGTLLWSRHRFAWPRRADLAPVLSFGWHVLASRFSWYAYSNSDFLVAGRVLGAAPLGQYTMAWTLASVPLDKIMGLVTGVTPAFFSSVQHDVAALRRYLLGVSQVIALVIFPVTVGLALVAPDLVPLLLGMKWGEAVLPLQVLSIYAAFRSLMVVFPQVMMVTGLSRFHMYHCVAIASILPLAFYVGSAWGGVGIALVWITLYPLVELPAILRVLRAVDLSFAAYSRVLFAPASSTVAMVVTVAACRALLAGFNGIWWGVALAVSVGAASYVGALWLFHKQTVRAALRLMTLVRR